MFEELLKCLEFEWESVEKYIHHIWRLIKFRANVNTDILLSYKHECWIRKDVGLLDSLTNKQKKIFVVFIWRRLRQLKNLKQVPREGCRYLACGRCSQLPRPHSPRAPKWLICDKIPSSIYLQET